MNCNRLLWIFLVSSFNVLLLQTPAFGQGQISPNPNPAGNTITLNNGSIWLNGEAFDNEGSIENFDNLSNEDTISNFGDISNKVGGQLGNNGTGSE